MQVKDIMDKSPLTVSAEESIVRAAQLIRQANSGCLVVTCGGAVRGVVTDRELALLYSSDWHWAGMRRISQNMVNPVVAVEPDVEIIDAIHLMASRNIKHLPVVEQGRLVGLLSLANVAETLKEPKPGLLAGMGT